MTLKLLGHDPSPFVRRTRVLLLELGLPFERDSSGWITPTGEFKDASPIQRLPVLDVGPSAKTRYIYDSRVIARRVYDEAAKAKAVPAKSGDLSIQPTLWNPALDYEDENVLSTIDAALDSAINVYLVEQAGAIVDQNSYLQRQVNRGLSCLGWLDGVYKSRTTLTPGTLSYADIAMVSAVGWFRFRKRADVSIYPALIAVEDAFKDRPSFVSTNPYGA